MVSKKLKLSSKRKSKSKRSSKHIKRSAKRSNKRSSKRSSRKLCLYDWNCPSDQKCEQLECVKKSKYNPVINVYKEYHIVKPVENIYEKKLFSNLYTHTTKRSNGEDCFTDNDCNSKFCDTRSRKCITMPPPPPYHSV